jgi:hypothetical protein
MYPDGISRFNVGLQFFKKEPVYPVICLPLAGMVMGPVGKIVKKGPDSFVTEAEIKFFKVLSGQLKGNTVLLPHQETLQLLRVGTGDILIVESAPADPKTAALVMDGTQSRSQPADTAAKTVLSAFGVAVNRYRKPVRYIDYFCHILLVISS